jgi:polysaccharide export outer membrane protein
MNPTLNFTAGGRTMKVLRIACALLLAAAFWPRTGAAQEVAPKTFRLGPGDKLSVVVWKQPSLSLQLAVGPDGVLRFPLIGDVKAAGLTVSEVEDEIATGLKKHLQEPQVGVSLAEVQSYRIYVIGEVQRPGEHVAPGPVTVVQAIALAFGFTPFAHRDRVTVVGPPGSGRPVRHFDYERFVAQQAMNQSFVLQPGDTVVVQ